MKTVPILLSYKSFASGVRALLALPILLGASQASAQAVHAWGSNNSGQAIAPAGDFVAIAAGPGHSLAVRKDGTLAAWGNNSNGQTNVPTGTYKAVAGGSYHSLAIRVDGTLAAWGDNGWGQCSVPAGTFKAVAAGAFNSLAIRTDGTLVGWGNNAYGQTNVPSGTYTAIAARQAHCLALRSDGVLVGWGTNEYGQRTIPPGTYKAVSTGNFHSLAIRTDGTVVGFGSSGSGQTPSPAGTFVAVSAGAEHSLAIRSDGTLHAWGNLGGGLGSLPSGRFQAIASGTYHCLALEAPKWTFASLHPAGAWYSAAWAAGDGQIGGVAAHGSYGNAALWTDLTVGSYVDLSGDLDGSDLWDVAGGVQVGSFSNISAGTNAANLWQGSPTSFFSLPQHDYRYGVAAGTDGYFHVGGFPGANNYSVAVLWSGTTASTMTLTVLHPQTADWSHAYGVANGVQVGSATFANQPHASVWYGNEASWVDIHPAGATASEAFRTDGTQHVGHVWNFLGMRAALWTSNSQWTDLTPLGYDAASAYNIGFGHQVGHAMYNGNPRAMIWSGSAGLYEDLHDYLPIEYAAGGSYAWDLDKRDGMLVVVGEAFNTVTGQTEAVIWVTEAPNQAPVADAGPDQTVTVPHDGSPWTNISPVITLSGVASSDPDGDSLTYLWSLGAATWPTSTFQTTLPVGTHTFLLRVTDPSGLWSEDQVVVTVLPEPNQPPVADAGPDVVIYVPREVGGTAFPIQVTGVGTDADGDPLTFQWLLNGSVISNEASLSYSLSYYFSPYTVVFRVTDSYGVTSTDSMVLEVRPPLPPNADGPRARQDGYQGIVGESVTINPLENDWHTQNLSIRLYRFFGPSNAQILPDGRISLSSPPAPGMMHHTYIIIDDAGRTATGTVKVNWKKK
ncbi:MAG: hypothetical protein IT363_02075 [Methanoregulaceae archaeon]|nr:hypothetical protein [Methanoregulaceae archaeon]